MATFVTKRMIFLHVPKTGGSWVTEAVRSAGVPAWAPDRCEDHSRPAPFHADLQDVTIAGRFSVAFVRHPLDWWRSYWGYRMRTGWDPANGIDAAASDDFNDFVLNVLDQDRGSFGEVVRRFVGLPSPNVDFVGRFEHLVEDTCEALRLGGERFCAAAIRQRPHENVNDYHRFPALYRPEVAARLAEAERQTIERFYAEDPIPARLVLGGGADPPSPPSAGCDAASHDLRRAERHVRALERALSLSRQAEARLESALTQAHAERDQAAHALTSLRSSHLLRCTRRLRGAYYRARAGGSVAGRR